MSMMLRVNVARAIMSHELEISVAHREDDGAYSVAKVLVPGDASEEVIGSAIGALAVFIAKGISNGRSVCLASTSVAYDLAAPIDFGRL